MTQLILDGILKSVESEHYLRLLEYLKSLRLLYEKGQITEQEYRRIEETLTQTMTELRTRLKSRRGQNTFDMDFLGL
jgi:hypothetical protein